MSVAPMRTATFFILDLLRWFLVTIVVEHGMRGRHDTAPEPGRLHETPRRPPPLPALTNPAGPCRTSWGCFPPRPRSEREVEPEAVVADVRLEELAIRRGSVVEVAQDAPPAPDVRCDARPTHLEPGPGTGGDIPVLLLHRLEVGGCHEPDARDRTQSHPRSLLTELQAGMDQSGSGRARIAIEHVLASGIDPE